MKRIIKFIALSFGLFLVSNFLLVVIDHVFIIDCFEEKYYPWILYTAVLTIVVSVIILLMNYLLSRLAFIWQYLIGSCIAAAIIAMLPLLNDVYYLEQCTHIFFIPLVVPNSLIIGLIPIIFKKMYNSFFERTSN